MHTVVGRFSRLSSKNQRIVAQIQGGFPGVDPLLCSECDSSFVRKGRLASLLQRCNPVYLDSGYRSDRISFRASEINPQTKAMDNLREVCRDS